MMCHEYEERLSAFYDGELDRTKVPELMTHLAGCSSCRTFLASLASIQRAEMSMNTAEVPATLDERVRRLAAHRPGRPARFRDAAFAIWKRRFALPVPAIGIFAVVVLWAGLLLWSEAERASVTPPAAETQIIYVMEMPPVVVQGTVNGNTR